MGYILPINSYRSQQYANRLIGVESNYSKISQLHHINKVGDVMEGFEEAVSQEKAKAKSKAKIQEEKKPLAAADSQDRVIGYVHPNPANLSVANAQVVRKGAVINAYI